ncbi:MAG: hypothetical protein COB56_00975 [Robiginitomaculum sp.]|nr:MAG: hypothetical protein COB56_00975 [Robiginitomaculum sp.]
MKLKAVTFIALLTLLSLVVPTSHAQNGRETEVRPGTWVENLENVGNWTVSKAEVESGSTCYAYYSADFDHPPTPLHVFDDYWGLSTHSYGLAIIANVDGKTTMIALGPNHVTQLSWRKQGDKFFESYDPTKGIPLYEIPENVNIELLAAGFKYPSIHRGHHSYRETYNFENLAEVKSKIDTCKKQLT